VKPSEARAADFFKKACAAKDAKGCADDALAAGLGMGQKADPSAAIDRLSKQCKTELVRACGNLGVLYNRGLAGPENVKLAEGLWVDACKKGDLESCTSVSAIGWRDGNLDRFDKYGRAACDNGDADGCASMGDLLMQSNEALRAATEYNRACQLGSIRGCTLQGLLLLDAGTDRKRALALLDRSCQLGDGRACDAARAVRDQK
jgi:TPR repeat protein